MTTQFAGTEPHPRGEHGKRAIGVLGAGSLIGALGAAGAVVLSILGLAGALPFYMVTVATIVLGAAMLLEGGAIAARYDHLVRRLTPAGEPVPSVDVAGGMSAESLAGIAGVTLGVLSLLGIYPGILEPVAVIVLGAGLLFASSAVSRLNAFASEYFVTHDLTRRVMRESVQASVGGEVLFGIGAVVLGILALLGFDPLLLTLVGLLAVGFAAMLSGSAVGARVFGILRHQH